MASAKVPVNRIGKPILTLSSKQDFLGEVFWGRSCLQLSKAIAPPTGRDCIYSDQSCLSSALQVQFDAFLLELCTAPCKRLRKSPKISIRQTAFRREPCIQSAGWVRSAAPGESFAPLLA